MEEKIIEVLSEVSGVPASEISMDTRVASDLSMSSFDLADTVVTVEETYGIHIPDERFKEIETVGDIVRIIGEEKIV